MSNSKNTIKNYDVDFIDSIFKDVFADPWLSKYAFWKTFEAIKITLYLTITALGSSLESFHSKTSSPYLLVEAFRGRARHG